MSITLTPCLHTSWLIRTAVFAEVRTAGRSPPEWWRWSYRRRCAGRGGGHDAQLGRNAAAKTRGMVDPQSRNGRFRPCQPRSSNTSMFLRSVANGVDEAGRRHRICRHRSWSPRRPSDANGFLVLVDRYVPLEEALRRSGALIDRAGEVPPTRSAPRHLAALGQMAMATEDDVLDVCDAVIGTWTSSIRQVERPRDATWRSS